MEDELLEFDFCDEFADDEPLEDDFLLCDEDEELPVFDFFVGVSFFSSFTTISISFFVSLLLSSFAITVALYVPAFL